MVKCKPKKMGVHHCMVLHTVTKKKFLDLLIQQKADVNIADNKE